MPVHVVSIADLPDRTISDILSEARTNLQFLGRENIQRNVCIGRNVALVFFEPSTRTRLSFETAAHRLGASTVTFQPQGSSLEKGESLEETLATIEAMMFDAIVVRHSSDTFARDIAQWMSVPVINAGSGMVSHPTQALLDASTLLEVMPSLKGIRIALIGDVRHSRVARSQVELLSRLGAEFAVCAPASFLPPDGTDPLFTLPRFDHINEALQWCTVASMLRIQRERISDSNIPSVEHYRAQFAFTKERAEMFPHAYIIHPGPVNEGVEIDKSVITAKQSLIRRQVTHGVAVRMAVLRTTLFNQESL